MRNGNDPHAEAEAFLSAHPDVAMVDLMLPDMSGALRGKQLARDTIGKLYGDGVRMPGSLYLMDRGGANIDALPYGITDGDPDYFCFAAADSLKPVPWARRPTGQVLASMREADGSPHFADPRHVLRRAAAPLGAMGLTPVIALELEFYLLDQARGPDGRPRIAIAPETGVRAADIQVCGIEEVYDFETLLGDIHGACAAQGIPTDTIVSECAPGQFEINLYHGDDPVVACDHAVLLKRAIKGVARRQGLLATFMAKPFAEIAGCGLHLHVSLLDAAGVNVFAGAEDLDGVAIGPRLRHAVGGLAATMAEGMAIFAPTANAYRRFRPGSYTPEGVRWGANDRTVALRLPPADAAAVRIEHRVAGADANPYLVAAAVLAGIHHGLANELAPPDFDPESGTGDALPTRWETALERFAAGGVLRDYLGGDYADAFLAIQRHDCEDVHGHIPLDDYDRYLRTA